MQAEQNSFESQRLMKDLLNKKLDQITAKAYLDQKVFGQLELSMNTLLETIERNGEFEKYVEMLADRQTREQRELRRRAREMKRLEMGDDYVSSDTDDSGSKESDWSATDDQSDLNASLAQQNLNSLMQSPSATLDANADEPQSAALSQKRLGSVKAQSIAADQNQVEEELFNPLRFIALHLKEQNEMNKSK